MKTMEQCACFKMSLRLHADRMFETMFVQQFPIFISIFMQVFYALINIMFQCARTILRKTPRSRKHVIYL